MFRAKLHIMAQVGEDYKETTIVTNSVKTWGDAELLLDHAVSTGFATGGHIEMKIDFEEKPGFMSSGWFLCNEKPELV